MKKLLPRLLALLLVLTMLPISALASLENHNVADVDIAVSTDENNYYFPDIIMHSDGTLLVCYYQNVMHVGASTGTIYMAESTDNGYTWSDPWEVVAYEGCDSRDPNLAVLPDGTVILTWFYGSQGDRDGTWMKFSSDKGRTWGEDVQLESDILDESMGKRGNIAVVNNENMLIPCYGVSSGINDYGAPATPIGERGQFSTYHRDAAILH